MAVPREALQGDATNRVVYVKHLQLSNSFERVPVVTGEKNDRYVEIVKGLFPGDQVVTKGSYSLSFAGNSSISLKEKLDADHGHEHNEDGTEKTPEQKATEKAAVSGGEEKLPKGTLFFGMTTGILLLLLIISSTRRKPASA